MRMLICVIALASCGDELPTDGDPESAHGRSAVVVLGDSTAVPWPETLQDIRPDLLVINLARNGAETTEIAEHQWALNARPLYENLTALVVLGGVNDIARNLVIGQAVGRLLGVYADAAALGLDVYAIVTLPYTDVMIATYGQSYADRMTELQTGIRSAPDPVVLIDLVDEFAAHQEWYADNVHPTAVGQSRIAQAVAGAIR